MTEKEIREKRKLYFEKGAEEVWICDEDGKITFYNTQGKLEQSILVPKFPHWIEL